MTTTEQDTPDRPTGLMPRGPERRQQHRRPQDAALHYARENLIAATLALVDNKEAQILRHGPATGNLQAGVADARGRLRLAVATYRAAETAAGQP